MTVTPTINAAATSNGEAADTKNRILDAAERLFAENGFAATSTRAITTEARVNLAAVNYHFGSKDALIFELLFRRVHRLNASRYALLEAAEGEHAPNPVPLEKILGAFYRPCLEMVDDKSDHDFLQLLGRSMYEHPQANLMLAEREWIPLGTRYSEAIALSMPELNQEKISWRLLFGIGGMVHAAIHGPAMHLYTGGKVAWTSRDDVLNKLVEFSAAGFRAEALQARKKAA